MQVNTSITELSLCSLKFGAELHNVPKPFEPDEYADDLEDRDDDADKEKKETLQKESEKKETLEKESEPKKEVVTAAQKEKERLRFYLLSSAPLSQTNEPLGYLFCDFN